MRHYTVTQNLISLGIGGTLGLVLGLCHYRAVTNRAPEYFERPEPVRYAVAVTYHEEPADFPEVEPVEKLTLDPDIPAAVQLAALKYGEEYNISPELLEAVAYAESRYDPAAENAGCMGLMQISTRWHTERMERLGVEDIFDLDGNMAVGADYLRELFDQYEDAAAVLMYYNGDAAATAYLNGEAPISDYADGILTHAAELEARHGK